MGMRGEAKVRERASCILLDSVRLHGTGGFCQGRESLAVRRFGMGEQLKASRQAFGAVVSESHLVRPSTARKQLASSRGQVTLLYWTTLDNT